MTPTIEPPHNKLIRFSDEMDKDRVISWDEETKSWCSTGYKTYTWEYINTHCTNIKIGTKLDGPPYVEWANAERAVSKTGYPMTYKRVVNRNRIADGDYNNVPVDWYAEGTLTAWSTVEGLDKEHVLAHAKLLETAHREAAEAYNTKVQQLIGDLRRLEKDSVDENSVCKQIAFETGIDENAVAAVLERFFSI